MSITTKAHLASNSRWNSKHPNRHKYYVYHSHCRTFLRKMAEKPDLLEAIEIARNRLQKKD